MSFKVIFLLCVSFFTFAAAQLVFPKEQGCPSFIECHDPIEMHPENLTGIWYLDASVSYPFQKNHKCTHYNFTVVPEMNNTVHFEKFEISET